VSFKLSHFLLFTKILYLVQNLGANGRSPLQKYEKVAKIHHYLQGLDLSSPIF